MSFPSTPVVTANTVSSCATRFRSLEESPIHATRSLPRASRSPSRFQPVSYLRTLPRSKETCHRCARSSFFLFLLFFNVFSVCVVIWHPRSVKRGGLQPKHRVLSPSHRSIALTSVGPSRQRSPPRPPYRLAVKARWAHGRRHLFNRWKRVRHPRSRLYRHSLVPTGQVSPGLRPLQFIS